MHRWAGASRIARAFLCREDDQRNLPVRGSFSGQSSVSDLIDLSQLFRILTYANICRVLQALNGDLGRGHGQFHGPRWKRAEVSDSQSDFRSAPANTARNEIGSLKLQARGSTATWSANSLHAGSVQEQIWNSARAQEESHLETSLQCVAVCRRGRCSRMCACTCRVVFGGRACTGVGFVLGRDGKGISTVTNSISHPSIWSFGRVVLSIRAV